MYEESSNYLKHYGVLGMRWGQRMLQNRITNAKSIGNKEKAKKLQKRFDENKSIRKMKTSDKIFLSREGVLANQRLIAKGQSKVARLVTLHGISTLTFGVSGQISNAITGPMLKQIEKGKHQTANIIAAYGINAATTVGAMKVRDKVYKELGKG